VRILLRHHSHYRYPRPAALGPHLIRLRPAPHTRARIETYSLNVTAPGRVRWQQDPAANYVARVTWGEEQAGALGAVALESRLPELDVLVELAVDIRPVNPFDFTLDANAERVPLSYGPLLPELAAYLDRGDARFACGALADEFIGSLPREGPSVQLLVEMNRRVAKRVRYVIREEPGIWTPEETLHQGRGSCRDSAVLLIAALRSRGLAARFASGYLVQLTDEGMLPDQPKGVSRDVADLHAWAEVFLPGAGWVGLDATSGLLCGEGHIPLACTASPAQAAPIEGTSDVPAEKVEFETRIGRLGHEVRPTAPFTDETWDALQKAGAATDDKLRALGIELTCGGEPTFNSRLHGERPEWNSEALGTTKWEQGLALARELRERLVPGGVLLLRQGKQYPGESLPRWTLELIGRSDKKPIWPKDAASDWAFERGAGDAALLPQALRLCEAIASRLGVAGFVHEAYEDPWRFVQEEAALPLDVDPHSADLRDPEERRRLARVLDRGLQAPAGFVLPLAGSRSERWEFRRGRLYLIVGDAPVGLRLPLVSLGPGPPPPPPPEEPFEPPDPRGPEAAEQARQKEEQRLARLVGEGKVQSAYGTISPARSPQRASPPPPAPVTAVRTALCVEPRGGALHVFIPPVATPEEFLRIVAAVDESRGDVPVLLEGYPPPRSKELTGFSVTPDPGVLEVNLPPTFGFQEHAALVDAVYGAALHTGLHAEKYLVDGRQAGSGGGNHLTLGGPTPLRSPFVRDPRLLASFITFAQHHPSLSYLFSGLFVGPTSQAPRLDEARHDALYEMEIALTRAFADEPAPPWLSDALFRHLLVDVTGNTHRAEICIDKLFDWRTPHGRQGLIELRAFEMPPHPRMMEAQAQLVRALVAAFALEPYRAPLVRWGQELHDRFLLPTWLWRDFEDVLAFLAARGLPHPAEAYRAFLELRCPVAGQLQAGDVRVEVRNALEPWNVLGEEPAAGGTSRYVDSSVERIEVRCEGLVPGRHEVLVNGHLLPLRPTGRAGEAAAGVRFRAWAPPHSLHPHLGVHHPLRVDVLDRWSRRSLGACAYHVWHPEGRAFETPPLTRFEAAARRAQRFTEEGPLPFPVLPSPASPNPDTPWTLDLRRL
jgi:uncharacterized protein (DUF2126 family)/transglutaminase-like putative cysteine protease